MDAIIRKAINIRQAHLDFAQPMTSAAEGFKEANIAHDMSAAFRENSFLVFPEFSFEGGAIDAVFVRGDEVVVCEWKRCWVGSAAEIYNQTQRLLRLDPATEFPRHGFPNQTWRVNRLWVCDAWDSKTLEWWMGQTTAFPISCPFDSTWVRGDHEFTGLRWSYRWIWAYK